MRRVWHIVTLNCRRILAAFLQLKLMWRLRHYKVINPPQSLGDVLFYAHMVKRYKELHPGKKVAFLFKDSGMAAEKVARLFDTIDKCMALDTFGVKCLIPWVNKYYRLSLHFRDLKHAEENYARAMDPRMGYEPGCSGKPWNVSPEIEDLFQGDGCYPQGKTVLICPDATSCKVDDKKAFWLALAARLRGAGLVPVFNAKPGVFAGFDSVFFDIISTVSFVSLGGAMISIRSGIVDMVAYFTGAKLVALYPSDWNYWSERLRRQWGNLGENALDQFMNAWSVKRIFARENVLELPFAFENPEEIVSFVKG